jgi:nucleotide-binding universal stress UspA family protein
MHYLVAVDGSDASTSALSHAIELANALEGSLTIAYAVESRVLIDDAAGESPTNHEIGDRIYTEDTETAEERGSTVLESAAKEAAEAGIDVNTELLYGQPVEAIESHASNSAVDGVIVGHRALSGRVEGMVGSVAKGLVERAPVPVTVVK